MAISDKYLILDRPHKIGEGRQRLYRIGVYGLSLVNPKQLHAYEYAWKVAIIKYTGLGTAEDPDYDLVYSTGLTDDVEVFDTDEETNFFIGYALGYLTNMPENIAYEAVTGKKL